MSVGIILVVPFAAILHASWNALLRALADRPWSMTIMCVAIALSCAALAFVVPVPTRASWPYTTLSALLHVGNNLFLVRSSRSGNARPVSLAPSR